MNPTFEEENKQAQELLAKDLEESRKFTEGVSGTGPSTEEKPPADPVKKEGEDQNPTPPATPEPVVPKEEEKNGETPTPPISKDEPPVVKDEPVPPKHIPVQEFNDKKKTWESDLAAERSEKEALKARVAELEALAGGQKSDIDADIKAYATEHGLDENQVKGLVDIARKGMELPKEKLEILERTSQQTLLQEEKTHFEGEFTSILPTLKEQYPTATAEQLEAIKSKLWEVGHKPEYFDKEMDYVLYKNKADIDALVTPSAPAPVKEPTPGRVIEHSNPGHGKDSAISAKDFVGKSDFSAMKGLPDDEQKRLVKEMDAETRLNWSRWVGDQETGVEVNRGGRTIRLK